MHHPTDRITHTTAFVKPVVEHWLEREIARVMRVCYMCCVGVRCSAIAHGWVGWGGGLNYFCAHIHQRFMHHEIRVSGQLLMVQWVV